LLLAGREAHADVVGLDEHPAKRHGDDGDPHARSRQGEPDGHADGWSVQLPTWMTAAAMKSPRAMSFSAA